MTYNESMLASNALDSVLKVADETLRTLFAPAQGVRQPPLPPDAAASPSSIGIANVRSRLRGLHGDGGDLCIRDEPGRGVRVTITVPWRETP